MPKFRVYWDLKMHKPKEWIPALERGFGPHNEGREVEADNREHALDVASALTQFSPDYLTLDPERAKGL